MAQKPRAPTFEVLIAARVEQAQIAIAELYKSIGEIANVVDQLDGQVAELLARPAPPSERLRFEADPPRRRLLAGRWPLRDGNVYPRDDTPLPDQPPYEEGLALRSPPAMT
jgi:hypothetical protein